MNSILNSSLSSIIAAGIVGISTSVMTVNAKLAEYDTINSGTQIQIARLEAQIKREADLAREERQRLMDILLERLW